MPYIGKSPVGGGFHKLDNLTASATATYALTLGSAAYYPETANQLLVSLNGVIQAPQDSFTVSGSNLIFDTALTASDSIDFVVALGDVLGVQGVTDGAVTTNKIANGAVTSAKLDTNINISGNVGIGTTSPASYGRLAVMTPTANFGYFGIGNSVGGGGGVNIGSFYGTTKISYIDTVLENGTPSSEQSRLQFATIAGGTLTERMRIDSSGNVLVGTSVTPITSANSGTVISSVGYIESKRNTTVAASHLLFYNPNGLCGYIYTSGTSTSYLTSSDYRLKENVTADWDATTRLKQLNPVRFNFIADADTTVDGFLAHEVQDIVPEAISGTKDGMRNEEYEVTPAVLDDDGNEVTPAVMGTRSVPNYQGIDQSKLVPLLCKTILELEARITALEAN